jgi:hypothetical protein
MSALRIAWRHSTRERCRPLATAVRTKSSLSTSSSVERDSRAKTARLFGISVTAGSTSESQPSLPPTGSTPRWTANTRTITSPIQNTGADTPRSAKSSSRTSTARPSKTAAVMPRPRPATKAMPMAVPPSSSVAGRRLAISSATGCLLRMERPKSPWATFFR